MAPTDLSLAGPALGDLALRAVSLGPLDRLIRIPAGAGW